MSIETSIGLETGQPYPYRRRRAGRARLDPVPGLEGRHRRGLGSRCSGSARTASRTSASCASCWATWSTRRFYADLERDQAERATMSMLVPPQMMNTMAPRRGRRADPAR